MIRIKDIAEKAGTSTSAVSFVLNGKGNAMRISQDTQNKILDAAEKLGYAANVQARRLKSADYTPLIALYWPMDIAGLPIESLLDGLYRRIRAGGGDVEIVLRPYKVGKLAMSGIEKSENKYNAILIAWASGEEQAYIEECNLSIPQCYIGNAPGKSLSFESDLAKAGRETARLFAGHKVQHVGFVGVSGKSPLLMNGFQDGCREYGLRLDPEDISIQQAQPSGGSLAAEEILLLAERPDAVLFESGLAAAGALSAWNKGGIKIPEEMRIVACGSPALLEYLSPSVTAVTFPVEAMAEDALSAILSSIGGGKVFMQKTYEPEFIFRESCGPFPGKKAYRIFI